MRRLAVHVEDHPIEYLGFEGVIPSGEYGGGDVIVWDTGTWEPHGTDDPAASVAAGELHADVATPTVPKTRRRNPPATVNYLEPGLCTEGITMALGRSCWPGTAS